MIFYCGTLIEMKTIGKTKSKHEMARKIEERNRELDFKNLELEKLSLVASKTNNSVMIFNKDMDLEYVNQGFVTMVGYTLDEFCNTRGKNIKDISFYENFDNLLQQAIATKDSVQYESKMYHKNGNVVYASTNLTPIFDSNNELQNLVIIDTDITRLKKYEEQLQASLNERSMLLREIHHRVKNNLQIIISLFNLQSYHIKDEAALMAMLEAQQRVRSLALIHERFYQSEGLSKIDFDDYIQRLASNLFTSYNVSKEKVNMKILADKVNLDIDTAVPCGLIVNELISNAFKHAFNEAYQGELKIEFREIAPENYLLKIKDNGKGLPSDFDIKKSDTLGMQLVSALAEQIDGKYSFENNNGLVFSLEFKKVKN